jgi:hypothetical protein
MAAVSAAALLHHDCCCPAASRLLPFPVQPSIVVSSQLPWMHWLYRLAGPMYPSLVTLLLISKTFTVTYIRDYCMVMSARYHGLVETSS